MEPQNPKKVIIRRDEGGGHDFNYRFSLLVFSRYFDRSYWWQDRYLTVNSKFTVLAKIAEDNELHHTKPEAMGYLSIWENVNTSAPYGLGLAAILYFSDAAIILWLTVVFASFGNLVHRFSHVPKNKIPVIIQWFQKIGLFISPKHHSKHHRNGSQLVSKKDSYEKFCPMSDWMNPILDAVGFFPFLEKILSKIGVKTIG